MAPTRKRMSRISKIPQITVDCDGPECNGSLMFGCWSRSEDERLIDAVRKNGEHNWKTVAEEVGNRTGKQCRERYINLLAPEIKKTAWTPQEDEIIISKVAIYGSKWSEITKFIPGRTENAIKNRWYSTLFRRMKRIENGEAPDKKRGRKKSIVEDFELPELIPREDSFDTIRNLLDSSSWFAII